MRNALIAVVWFSLASPAFAHPLDIALVNLEGDSGQVHLSLEMNPAAEARGTGSPLADASLSIGGTPCALISSVREMANPTTVRFRAEARCPALSGRLQLKLPFLTRQTPSYRAIFMSRVGGKESAGDALPERPWIEVDVKPEAPSIASFVGMGIEHIGATPREWVSGNRVHLPEGIDHILFVVALVLSGGGLFSLFKTVSGFTVGHSITLALATLGVIHVPSRIVESAIALSIAVVAVEGLFFKGARWKIALAFGLVHGLGFASALSDLHLGRESLFHALLGFNLGVEIGQAVIVAAVFPLLLALRYGAISRRYAIPACTWAVFAIGSVWFVERAFIG